MHSIGSICAAALLTVTLPAAAPAATARVATWTRAFPAPPSSDTAAPILQPLPGGMVLVRAGSGAAAIDAHGRTVWSMPNVDDATLDGAMVVFVRSDVVFAVRARDAGLVWKRKCADPMFAVVAGARLVTACDGAITVLRARDGTVLAAKEPMVTTSPPHITGAVGLNDDYVLVANFFDGAWMGTAQYVADAHTGALLWSQTDIEVLNVTPATITISALPSMLPSGTGRVETRRLRDGIVLRSKTFPVPKGADTEDQGTVNVTTAATYVTPLRGTPYRFPGGAATPQRVGNPFDSIGATLGDAAFVVDEGLRGQPSTISIDRPAGGTFATRAIATFTGKLSQRVGGTRSLVAAGVERIDDRIAVLNDNGVSLYDHTGAVELSAPVACLSPQLSATRDTLYVLCAQQAAPATLSAFRRH
jgi:hypothetical protein